MMNEDPLDILVKNSCFEFSDSFIVYSSGKVGQYYVHSENITRDGYNYSNMLYNLKGLVEKSGVKYDIITGGESRDWVFSLPVAALTLSPHAMIRKNGSVIGAKIENSKVMYIAI